MDDQGAKAQSESSVETKLKVWIEHLKQVDLGKNEEAPVAQETADGAEGDRYHVHLKQMEISDKRKKEIAEERKKQLRLHLDKILPEQKKEASYNMLSIMEKKLYSALARWCNAQPGAINDGILEFHFKKSALVKTRFEPIIGDFDSTMKIKKLNASDKVKEMLLVFRRKKNIFLEFYKKDLQENIFTFMFLDGKIQSNQNCREVYKVIHYFSQFGPNGLPS